MKRDARQVLTEWLVLEAQSGSERAFRDLHDLWREDFRRMALVRVEHPDAADEVLTDIWLAVARGLPRLDDPACFPRWAFQIVQRRAADWVRQQQLARQREHAAAADADLLAPAPLTPAESSDDVLALREAIKHLPTEQRELLHLRYGLERGLQEIADILELPVGTVKSRLHTTRELLKQQLKAPKT
ncbi:MAG: RNA polymerase sigma factor [Verrucomicrobiota bacterium]|nr:RNA polymerase sigma factor [Verrucomicrobiota bacterium]